MIKHMVMYKEPSSGWMILKNGMSKSQARELIKSLAPVKGMMFKAVQYVKL